jgi:branched-chain amino acid transport system substrate-binding protein
MSAYVDHEEHRKNPKNQQGGKIVRSKKLIVMSLLVLVLGLMSVGVLAGCGSNTDETATTAAVATTAPAVTTTVSATDTTVASTETTAGAVTFAGDIVIGAVSTMTGPGAMGGAEQKWAQEKAVADINAKGGVKLADGKNYQLVLKFLDDKSDAVEAAAAVEKLIKVEGLKIILSTQTTPLNLAAATVAEKYGAFYQMTEAFTNVVAEQKFKWSADMFFTPQADGDAPFQLFDSLPATTKPATIGLLTSDDSDGQAVGAGVQAAAKAHGYELVAFESYTPGTKDYASVLLKFKQAKIDALLCFVSAADGITFVKQMKEQNFSPKIVYGWKGFWPTEFMKGLGADSNYILHNGVWSDQFAYPGAKELGQAYIDTHDGNSSVMIGAGYAVVQVLAMAIERAGSTDPAKVRDQVFNGTFKGTVEGDLTYAADGTAQITDVISQWMDGKRVMLFPEAGNELAAFVPWDQR